MTNDQRLDIVRALIAKLPTFELMWPGPAKDRWFAAFHRLMDAASKAEWSVSNELSCRWEADDDGNWGTGCANTFVLNDGGPIDNKMRFCPYCGKRLEQALRAAKE